MKIFLFSCSYSFVKFFKLHSDQQSWKLIGDKQINFLIDRDFIHVTGNDKYSQLELNGSYGPVHILDMDIYIEPGDKFDFSVKNKIPKGGESRVIDLAGESRRKEKLNFGIRQKNF